MMLLTLQVFKNGNYSTHRLRHKVMDKFIDFIWASVKSIILVIGKADGTKKQASQRDDIPRCHRNDCASKV